MDPARRIWTCTIGEVPSEKLPHGSDQPMRDAVARAFKELTGIDNAFIFSGWGDDLPEKYRAVIEDRDPDPLVLRDELMEQLIPVEEFIANRDPVSLGEGDTDS